MKTKPILFLTQISLVLLLLFSGRSLLFCSPHLSHSKCWTWNTERCSNTSFS